MKCKLYMLGILIGVFACKKEQDIHVEKEPQTDITFNYGGQEVTYKPVKKVYYLDANGDSLDQVIVLEWLDRNLGAERQATYKDDPLAAGDLFQWGRDADGHQKRESDTTHTLSESITPNHSKYIVKPLYAYDWLLESNDSLWNDIQNTNCACPEGWRIPTIEELSMEMHSWSSKDMDGAYASALKWVSGGSRDNHGIERYSDEWAFVWSSTALASSYANQLAIIGNQTAQVTSSIRMYAGSVRCIKD